MKRKAERTILSKQFVTIRELRISDIYPLHQMYNLLSNKSKRFFHPSFVGSKCNSPQWLFAQFALATSTFSGLKKILLRLYPYSVFLSLVSINEFNEIVGFGFVKVKSRISKESFLGELGIFLRDDYQGKCIGSVLMKRLMESAENENVNRIFLTVLTNNQKAIHMYKKYGFRKIRTMRNYEVWQGEQFDSYEMTLELR
jgi:RimJ/RimL family protein N-acetyltransferase